MHRLSRILRNAFLIAVLVGLWAPLGGYAQTQRALLIGIDTYASDDGTSRGSTRGWTNLDGAVNDARTMQALLVSRFGFEEDNTTLLLNRDATREGILAAVRTHLIEQAEAGDEVVFFYAGHGSQVKNTASTEADRMDETIVPSDAHLGVQDVRDKEMRQLFGELLDRGVELTLIYDSCHSGSVTRGVAPGKTRALKPNPEPIHAPGPALPPPQEREGVLVLSAAQDSEKAKEVKDDEGTSHGAFTWALTRTLRTMPLDLPADLMFQRVRALMRAHGFSQEPVIEGRPSRRDRALFAGAGTGTYGGTRVAALGNIVAGAVDLQGGRALGLVPGTELRKLYAEGQAPADSNQHVRVRIVSVRGLARSEATVIQGDPSTIHGGDFFLVDRWVASGGTPLRVWLPPALDPAVMARTQSVFAALRRNQNWTWVTDPTQTPPTHAVLWSGTEWTLTRPDGSTTSIGTTLSAERVAQALGEVRKPVVLFASLPPTSAIAQTLNTKLSALDRPVARAQSLEDAHYVLGGTVQRGRPAYYWFYRPATEGVTSAVPPRITRAVEATNVDRVGAVLADFVYRIDRSWGWLQLESPPDAPHFPYALAGFEETQTGTFVAPTDTLHWRAHYRVVLEASPDALRSAQRSFDAGLVKRYFYIFAIDIEGNGTLLYGTGNSENTVNFVDDIPDPERIVLPRSGKSLFQSWPTRQGELEREVDTFVLLTTSEPLSDPTILNFTGVRSRGERAGVQSPFERALFSIAHGTRGTTPAVPSAWSIQRVPMVSTRPH